MRCKVSRGFQEETPRAYLEWVEGKYNVPAVRSSNGEVFYLSITNELQQAGYKRVDIGKVMYVSYCGERKLIKLYKLVKVD